MLSIDLVWALPSRGRLVDRVVLMSPSRSAVSAAQHESAATLYSLRRTPCRFGTYQCAGNEWMVHSHLRLAYDPIRSVPCNSVAPDHESLRRCLPLYHHPSPPPRSQRVPLNSRWDEALAACGRPLKAARAEQ